MLIESWSIIQNRYFCQSAAISLKTTDYKRVKEGKESHIAKLYNPECTVMYPSEIVFLSYYFFLIIFSFIYLFLSPHDIATVAFGI